MLSKEDVIILNKTQVKAAGEVLGSALILQDSATTFRDKIMRNYPELADGNFDRCALGVKVLEMGAMQRGPIMTNSE